MPTHIIDVSFATASTLGIPVPTSSPSPQTSNPEIRMVCCTQKCPVANHKMQTTMSSKKKEEVEEEEYIVEKILNKQISSKHKTEHFQKWKGFDESKNSWKPVEKLDCPELIKAYEDSVKDQSPTAAITASSSKKKSEGSTDKKRKMNGTESNIGGISKEKLGDLTTFTDLFQYMIVLCIRVLYRLGFNGNHFQQMKKHSVLISCCIIAFSLLGTIMPNIYIEGSVYFLCLTMLLILAASIIGAMKIALLKISVGQVLLKSMCYYTHFEKYRDSWQRLLEKQIISLNGIPIVPWLCLLKDCFMLKQELSIKKKNLMKKRCERTISRHNYKNELCLIKHKNELYDEWYCNILKECVIHHKYIL